MRYNKDCFHYPPTFCHDKSRTYFPSNFTRTKGKDILINPGTVYEIHKNARNIMPIWIEGVQLNARKLFGINKTGYCNWNFGHSYPTGCRIGGTYQKQLSDDVLITPYYGFDINPSTFSTNFGLVYYPHPNLGVELSLQAMPWNIFTSNFLVNYNSQQNTISCVLHEPKRESGRFVISDLYKISPTLCVGGELMLQWCKKEMIKSQIALAGK